MSNETYFRKVSPYILKEYFQDIPQQTLFDTLIKIAEKYNKIPSKEMLLYEFKENKKLKEEELKNVTALTNELYEKEVKISSTDWLVQETEKFCKDQAIFNALKDAIDIVDNKDSKSTGDIPEILKKALSVSFETSIGIDFLLDKESRYDYYTRKEEKVPFKSQFFNLITKGGVSKKTLNLLLAGVHSGKTSLMVNLAAENLLLGHNVLFITLEMSQEEISRKFDSNLMDMDIEDIPLMQREKFVTGIDKIKDKTKGTLIVKEFPTASASVLHIRNLLNELALKKDFVPDIIYIDYLNLLSSYRIKSSVGSYFYMKSVAEEIRGLASERNLPIFSATQLTRSGSTMTDPEMSDISESFAVSATVDSLFSIVRTPEFTEDGVVMIKQLKNRYRDLEKNKKFFMKFDGSKSKFTDHDFRDGNVIDFNRERDVLKNNSSMSSIKSKNNILNIE